MPGTNGSAYKGISGNCRNWIYTQYNSAPANTTNIIGGGKGIGGDGSGCRGDIRAGNGIGAKVC